MLKHNIHQLLKFFYPLVKKILPYQVYAYLAVGAANTALNIGLFIGAYLLLQGSPLAVEAATAGSFIITVLTGFWLSKNFAFTSAANGKAAVRQQFRRYALVALQGQISDYLITKALIVFLYIHPSAAYLLSTIIMLIINYFLQKYYTFRSKKINVQ